MRRVYLGSDIGHCETAVSVIDLDNQNNPVKLLNLDGNHYDVIPTAISLSTDQIRQLGKAERVDTKLLDKLGEIRIGYGAKYQIKEDEGEYFVYFKRCPAEFGDKIGQSAAAKESGLTCGKLMAAFLYQLIKNIRSFNTGVIGPEDELIWRIGCPSSAAWTDTSAYAKLAHLATGIDKVSVVPESRAAMFSAVSSGNTAISAQEGVMVFDFGSSTADSTYMLLGCKIQEYSWNLGASRIEEQLLTNAHIVAIEQDKTAKPKEQDSMLRSLRMAKEAFYQNGGESDLNCKFTCSDGTVKRITVDVQKDTMDQVTASNKIQIRADGNSIRTGSWRALCTAFMQKGRDFLLNNELPCKTVILTGGASHMDFIPQIAREVFGKDVIIVRDKNPSYCVAKGLGWVAVADDRRGACIEDAKKQLMDAGKWKYGLLERSIQVKIYEYLLPSIVKATNDWAKLPDKHSVTELEGMINKEVDTAIANSNGDSVRKLIENQISIWRDCFVQSAANAINNQASKVFSANVAAGLLVNEKVFERLDASSLTFNMDMEGITNNIDFASLTNVILQQVTYFGVLAAVATALAILAPGIGTLVATIISLITALIGQNLVADNSKNKLRDQRSRQRIAGKMQECLQNSSIVNKVAEATSNSLSPLKQNCEEAINEESIGNMVTAGIDMILLQPDSFRQHT